MSRKVERHWVGAPPERCDICRVRIKRVFVDGRTDRGPWANMCGGCHHRYGVGLGLGLGQRYERQADGRWLKTAG